MKSTRRLRREIEGIQRQMKRASYDWGQTVLWYEFDPSSVADPPLTGSTTGFDDDLYDEGGPQFGGGKSRKWFAPKPVQVYQAMLDEGAEQYTDVGQYMVDRLSLIVSYAMLVQAGIKTPAERGAHIKDRIEYDGRLFRVQHYEPRGRVGGALLTVTVSAVQVMDDERQTDDPNWHA